MTQLVNSFQHLIECSGHDDETEKDTKGGGQGLSRGAQGGKAQQDIGGVPRSQDPRYRHSYLVHFFQVLSNYSRDHGQRLDIYDKKLYTHKLNGSSLYDSLTQLTLFIFDQINRSTAKKTR